MVKADPKNPWKMHNMAIVYLKLKDFDKCIDTEKQAIAITDFGAARKLLAEAYVAKADDAKAREPASASSKPGGTAQDPEYIDFMLEAVKYDNRNLQALNGLSTYQLTKFQRSKNRADLEKGKRFLLQAAASDKKDPGVHRLMLDYQKAETSTPTP